MVHDAALNLQILLPFQDTCQPDTGRHYLAFHRRPDRAEHSGLELQPNRGGAAQRVRKHDQASIPVSLSSFDGGFQSFFRHHKWQL